jgi:hypothetical protein
MQKGGAKQEAKRLKRLERLFKVNLPASRLANIGPMPAQGFEIRVSSEIVGD